MSVISLGNPKPLEALLGGAGEGAGRGSDITGKTKGFRLRRKIKRFVHLQHKHTGQSAEMSTSDWKPPGFYPGKQC